VLGVMPGQGAIRVKQEPPKQSKGSKAARSAIRYRGVVIFAAALALLAAFMPSASHSKVPLSQVSTTVPAGVTPAAPPGTPGTTVGGYRCGPGIRQVPWTKYAPICEPAWHGNNGGATAPGVTATTITVTYREALSHSEEELLGEVAPGGEVGTNASAVSAMKHLIAFFNKNYELYGRHVVLKAFRGKGNLIAEETGGDQAQAEADAVTAAQTYHAFADVSVLASTPPYDTALAQQHVIAIGGQYLPQSFYQRYAPYEYSPFQTCNQEAVSAAEVIGRSMAGMKAIYAGSPELRAKRRVFGLLYPDSPDYASCAKEALNMLRTRYHVHMAVVIGYAFQTSQLGTEAQTAIAKLRSNGVTSILCACDPITPIFLAQDAAEQNYYPEWFAFSLGNLFARLPNQKEWEHAISGGIVGPVYNQTEAYRVFKMADPHGVWTDAISAIYEPLLMLFAGLQAAGPYLTPQTFERGIQSVAPSLPGGMFGGWSFHPGKFTAPSNFQIIRWDPYVVRPQGGGQPPKKGSWVACNGGTYYSYNDVAKNLPDHVQLRCPSV